MFRRIFSSVVAALALTACVSDGNVASASAPSSEPTSLGDARYSWEKATVVMPGGMKLTMTDAVQYHYLDHLPKGTVTILLLHGCSGLNWKIGLPFARLGYLVIEPDSMARPSRRPDCIEKTREVGLFPQAAHYRLQEIKYALTQLPTLRGVDMHKLVLMGHSEGAKASANWPGTEFRAIIVTGWGCHTKDSYYAGSKIPNMVPVLDLVAKQDIWLRVNNAGTCASAWRGHPVKLIINPEGEKHYLNDVYAMDIKRFIDANTR